MGLTHEHAQDYNQRLFNMLYAWLADIGVRQQIYIVTNAPGVVLPPAQMAHDTLLLTIDMTATSHLQVPRFGLTFNTRFGGKSTAVQIPWEAIRAVVVGHESSGRAIFMPVAFLHAVAKEPADVVEKGHPPATDEPKLERQPAPDYPTDDGKVVSLFPKRK